MMEVAQLKPGTIFGEISALTDAPRTAWIQAIGHVLLQEISQSQIEAVFLNNQTAMAEFAKVMATREAGLKTFTLEEKKTFELGLVERMTQTFSKLMSS
jgi:cAMP-binding proteins - catabolite gene activator and regulatory subunit of cAMP-dependent protein kinases